MQTIPQDVTFWMPLHWAHKGTIDATLQNAASSPFVTSRL
jgi:hypothetical protein